MNSPILSVSIVLINLVAILSYVNGRVMNKQAILETGRPVFLELGPRDPRSLMQGDYMVLRQGVIGPQHGNEMKEAPTRGRIVLALDGRNVGRFARLDDGGPLNDDETLLKYRRTREGYRFGLESFFFEEGEGEKYSGARYANVRISDKGMPVLVDLVGEKLEALE
ncbi:MAG: GDYXXLXY domain-containing protein [Verrucomicrobiota bacterium]